MSVLQEPGTARSLETRVIECCSSPHVAQVSLAQGPDGECTPQAWDDYVRRHPDAAGYHQFAWRRVFEEAFGHRAHYLAALRDGRVAGVLPLVAFRSPIFGRFAVSLPFVNYGGLLADDEGAAEALERHALRLAERNGWQHVELRHVAQRFPAWPSKRHKVAMWLPLPAGVTEYWDALDRKVRNQVRKAARSGVAVVDGGPELLDEFYRVFARNMRDLGTPVYSRAFFARVLANVPQARVFVGRVGGEPVAGSMTVRWRDRVEVPWASSLREHNDKAPNMALYDAMLRSAITGGAREFDFGRSTPGEGTFHFKRQWGARPIELVWEYLGRSGPVPDQSPTNPKFRVAIALWRRMPMRLANRLGPPIVRNIP